jgi:hypothetical protein
MADTFSGSRWAGPWFSNWTWFRPLTEHVSEDRTHPNGTRGSWNQMSHGCTVRCRSGCLKKRPFRYFGPMRGGLRPVRSWPYRADVDCAACPFRAIKAGVTVSETSMTRADTAGAKDRRRTSTNKGRAARLRAPASVRPPVPVNGMAQVRRPSDNAISRMLNAWNDGMRSTIPSSMGNVTGAQ